MKTLRIAAWSGPRNISTAMMRSWENRADTCVVDEPLYAHYLNETGTNHPSRDEVIEHYECDWEAVVASLTGECAMPIFYQKHMAHHLLPNISRDWFSEMTHVFLIRNPREMLTSLVKQLPEPRLEDTGLPQQIELLSYLERGGQTPIILDSKDVLQNPKGILQGVCHMLNIPFDGAMLSWPAGPRESDGIWAPHWYDSVEASTGFAPWKPKEEPLPPALETLCLECEAMYRELESEKLMVEKNNAAEV